MNDTHDYVTSDLYLAAYLSMEGHSPIGTDVDGRGKRLNLYFDDSDGSVTKARDAYYGRKAQGDVLTYADNVRSMKSLVLSKLAEHGVSRRSRV